MLKQILRDIKRYLKILKFNLKWRKINKENKTIARTIFPIEKVKVGKFTYGKLNIHYYNQKEEFLKIGSFCSIADEVHFFTGGNHNYRNLMTYPFKNILSKNTIQEATTKGPIIIEDDVWIGYGTIILSGVKIGKGAVIGAGSVVAKDIPPYAIYVRNEVIKYRFNSNIVEKLLKIDYGNIKEDKLEKLYKYLYREINESNIEEIISEVIK